MKRREIKIIANSGKYEVVEIAIHDKKTDKLLDTSYEVRNGHKFLTEFDNEDEAIQQMKFLDSLDQENE